MPSGVRGQKPKPGTAKEEGIFRSLALLDPILQFLTRATGQTLVPLESLEKTLPMLSKVVPFCDFARLLRFGILRVEDGDCLVEKEPTLRPSWENELRQRWESSSGALSTPGSTKFHIGFPSGDTNKKLCGSTKTAAKRRLAALKKHIKDEEKTKRSLPDIQSNEETAYKDEELCPSNECVIGANDFGTKDSKKTPIKDWTLPPSDVPNSTPIDEPILEEEKEARRAFEDVLALSWDTGNHKIGANNQVRKSEQDMYAPLPSSSLAPHTPTPITTSVLPRQLSYAGTQAGQSPAYAKEHGDDNHALLNSLHPLLQKVFDLGPVPLTQAPKKRLYKHQDLAIQSALHEGKHTLVCTGTGSGKSLCFWIPVLQRAILTEETSLLLFPTKALAQDQLVKLNGWLEAHPELAEHVTAAALDGDTPHSQRTLIAETCNIVVTNPDTLHAAILPHWESRYKNLLCNLKYVVIDEAHMYEGVFGAHVAMILARLYRVHCCSRDAVQTESLENDSQLSEEESMHAHRDHDDTPSAKENSARSLVFLACSATLPHPEHHFRLLCCIPATQKVTVLTDDFSPRASKHFFVWNPPLLDEHGKSLGFVVWPKKRKAKKKHMASTDGDTNRIDSKSAEYPRQERRKEIRRRHSADETALLLARAVTRGVRCIAFCKTRCLVEWVYERCIKTLKQSPETAHLISKVDSYRGGYSKLKRREIEEKLFHNQLLGVVGTSALELGVDIGGVGLTLHCGFPSSHASLMQQAGRAGRGAAASHQPSLAICVCFNSPIDQHLWRHPTSLLSRGTTAPCSMPISPGLVQGHLVCAGNEFPLTGNLNASAILSVEKRPDKGLLSDEQLFGSKDVYCEAMEQLTSKGSFMRERVAVFGGRNVAVFRTHPSIKNPWTEVSIRSIETVNYDIVDLSHPMQANRMDGNHHEAAVMDNIPYSRVFYHAFPGAIITHRGSRYKIVSMTRPPAFGVGFRSTITLGAYAKPSTHRYCTRPLSNLKITVVKQIERVDLFDNNAQSLESTNQVSDPSTIYSDVTDPSLGSFAGCGMITVKRNVHGYKKISLVTRDELSRSELSLPDMEYDTYAFWIDCDAPGLGKFMTPKAFGYGVHALSHALCNVSPLFVPCVQNDVQCDHSFMNPTRVVIFDSRAGGSGIAAQLWKSIFTPKGLVEAAIKLLETCSSCVDDTGYTGGCPACIQVGECIKFNDFLCKSSALTIARHMLDRLKKTERYKQNSKDSSNATSSSDNATKRNNDSVFSSPRREKRKRAMRAAMDIDTSRQRQLVIGRPSWPMDRSDGPPREQQGE